MVGQPSQRWFHFSPVLTQFLQKQNWWHDASGDFTARQDSYGVVCQWVLGADMCSPNRIFEVFVKQLYGKASEFLALIIYNRYRNENLAAGQDGLPTYNGAGFCVFAGHVHLLKSLPSNKFVQRAAFATGCSFWCHTAGNKISHEDPRTLCLCGAPFPSRPHLTWHCPGTQPLRANLNHPSDCVEERLFAKLVQEFPGAPPVHSMQPNKSILWQNMVAKFIPSTLWFSLLMDLKKAGLPPGQPSCPKLMFHSQMVLYRKTRVPSERNFMLFFVLQLVENLTQKHFSLCRAQSL